MPGPVFLVINPGMPQGRGGVLVNVTRETGLGDVKLETRPTLIRPFSPVQAAITKVGQVPIQEMVRSQPADGGFIGAHAGEPGVWQPTVKIHHRNTALREGFRDLRGCHARQYSVALPKLKPPGQFIVRIAFPKFDVPVGVSPHISCNAHEQVSACTTAKFRSAVLHGVAGIYQALKPPASLTFRPRRILAPPIRGTTDNDSLSWLCRSAW